MMPSREYSAGGLVQLDRFIVLPAANKESAACVAESALPNSLD